MGDTFRTGRSAAKRQAREAEENLAKQKQLEAQRTAEAEDDIARRKAVASRGGGRASLLAGGSETGVSSNLGG